MSPAVYLSFLLTCLIIEITPGPNMAYLAVLSAADGRRAGFAATLGIAAGLLIVGIAAALGVAAVISGSPLAYQVLRWGGVLYLLWLAWDGWRDDPETSPGRINAATQRVKFFRRGLVVNLLNPKAAVFYVAILPGFVLPSSSATIQAITLTVTYVAIATIVHSLIVLLAGTARDFLQNQRRRMILRRILSLALAAIAVWFASTTAGS